MGPVSTFLHMSSQFSHHHLSNRELFPQLLVFVKFGKDQMVVDVLFLRHLFLSMGLYICFSTSTMLF